MKILLTGTTGHLTFNITRLAQALKKIGLDVSVASTNIEEENGLISDLEKSKIKWFNIPRVDGVKMFNIDVFFNIRYLIQKENFDVIHTNSFHHFLWFYKARAVSFRLALHFIRFNIKRHEVCQALYGLDGPIISQFILTEWG